MKKENLPSKVCPVCKRPFVWKKVTVSERACFQNAFLKCLYRYSLIRSNERKKLVYRYQIINMLLKVSLNRWSMQQHSTEFIPFSVTAYFASGLTVISKFQRGVLVPNSACKQLIHAILITHCVYRKARITVSPKECFLGYSFLLGVFYDDHKRCIDTYATPDPRMHTWI